MTQNTLNIVEIAQACPGVSFQVGASDLARFGRSLIASAREEFLRERVLAGTSKLEPLFDATTVKMALKVSDSTLYRWAQKGYLCPIIVGGEKRYRQSDIDRIVNSSNK